MIVTPSLLPRIIVAIARRDLPLALAVEIEGQLHHAWREAADEDWYQLLILTRPWALQPLIDAITHASGLPVDEITRFRAWIDSDKSMMDYVRFELIPRGLSKRAFARAECGLRALSFFLKMWSPAVAIERAQDAGVTPSRIHRLLKDAGPPTLAEIVAAAQVSVQ